MKDIDDILLDFAKVFAEWDPREQAWWGHDTNLGDCKDEFAIAEQRIKNLIKAKNTQLTVIVEAAKEINFGHLILMMGTFDNFASKEQVEKLKELQRLIAEWEKEAR